MITANCRAMQHLLVQGFMLYTCPAAVCVALGARAVLDTHPWAVLLNIQSLAWVTQLPEGDSLRATLEAAASKGDERVVCHFEGMYLEVPLDVTEVRHAMARLQVAKNMSVPPPSIEGMQAIPDEVFEQEMKRRRLEQKLKGSDQTPDPAQG